MAKEIIDLGTVANDGTGDSIRVGGEKINDNFTDLYDVAGWGFYSDDLSTPTITVTTSFTQITINGLGASTNENYLPYEIRGSGHFFASSTITPVHEGDDYDGRLDIRVTGRTGTPTYIEFIIDISGSTPDTNRVFTGYLLSTNTTPYRQDLPIDFYTLATFKANGGKIYARVDTGTVTIGDRGIKLSRKGKGTL